MNRILAPIALAAAFVAAAITTTPRTASAVVAEFSDGLAGSCGQGSKVECGSTTVYTCVDYKEQVSFGTGGISITYFCTKSITQTSKSYKD